MEPISFKEWWLQNSDNLDVDFESFDKCWRDSRIEMLKQLAEGDATHLAAMVLEGKKWLNSKIV